MSQEIFNEGIGALAHPNAHTLPFNFDENDSPLALPPPPATRGHQRSRTAVDLPPLFTRTQSFSPSKSSTFSFLRPGSARSLSPERVTPAEADEFAVQDRSQSPTKRKSSGLAAWLEGGSSAPVNIGLVPSAQKEKLTPVEEVGTSEDLFSMSQDSLDNLTRRPQIRPKNSPSEQTVSTMSKFNIFRRSTTTLAPPEDTDELAQLDIDTALFPHGRPDEFSPAALRNLQQNAEGTIRRFQLAYREQRQSLRTVTSTKNVQADELEAAETRNEHLKLQLQEMAERAAEQEKLIAGMRVQLGQQRSSFESHQQSVRMVPEEKDTDSRPNYRRNRSSDVSMSEDSEVSSVASVFSEQLSIAPSNATSVESPENPTRTDCLRCHGMRPSDAWDVVSVMKIESAALKQRIVDLERAQDEVLDLINFPNLS
ncbi:hypothetical protein H2200_004169 [Cladophialophora chaetospira]|uniref:Uncharacterized protein n=1 Tax=Cladophialophora chaetospira TaxID=386627 RepID=A0AA38XFQ1_9EURO|nr:hypothetical protein H2200_004169 [Cladophialophora chaetospira]